MTEFSDAELDRALIAFWQGAMNSDSVSQRDAMKAAFVAAEVVPIEHDDCLVMRRCETTADSNRTAIRAISQALIDSGEVAGEGFILRLAEIAADAVGMGLPERKVQSD